MKSNHQSSMGLRDMQHIFFCLVSTLPHKPKSPDRSQYAYHWNQCYTTSKLISPFPYLLRLGDKSADLDLDPEGDREALPGDDLQ